MTTEQDDELKRQSLLLESLKHNEAFILWRSEVCTPTLEQIEMLLANSDQLSEEVLRANVKLQYLLKDLFYRIFDRVAVANDQERDINNQ